MHAYKTGELTAKEIFDVELIAKYFAITDVMRAHHGVFLDQSTVFITTQ